MNIVDAAHRTVHAYPGGSESLAPRIDMSPAVLRNKVNPNNTTHHLSLIEADELMAVTGDVRILHALADHHGYGLHKLECPADGGNVLQTLLVANASQGEFDRVLQEALADNVITQNEMKAIEHASVSQREALLCLLARLREFSMGQGGA
ncbi:phage regulatory CII family protein [Lysobacter sp. HA35]